jgi:hypothetical protein
LYDLVDVALVLTSSEEGVPGDLIFNNKLQIERANKTETTATASEGGGQSIIREHSLVGWESSMALAWAR